MERARERLRDVMLLIASAEASYNDGRSNNNAKVDDTFSRYMEHLRAEKHALQEEVLGYLGLHWVAPSPERGWTSRVLADSRGSTEPARPTFRLARDGEVHQDQRPSPAAAAAAKAFCPQAAVNDVRGTHSEPVLGAARNGDLEDWAHDGDNLTAAHGPSDGNAPNFDRSGSGKRARGSLHSSWRDSSNHSQQGQGHSAMTETRTSVMVTPPSAEDVVATTRSLCFSAKGAEVSCVKFSFIMATNIQQQPSVVSAVVSASPTLPSAGPYGRVDGIDAAEQHLERTVASTTKAVVLLRHHRRLLRAMAAEEPGEVGGRGGPSSAEPRIAPGNKFPSAVARLRPSTPPSSSNAVSRQTSMGNVSAPGASFRSSEEHDLREEESARGTVGRSSKNDNNAAWGTERPADGGIDEPLQPEHGVQDRLLNQTADAGGGLNNFDRPSSGIRENATRGLKGCGDVGCHRRPIYAFKGSMKASSCSLHRSEEMVNVRHPLCRHESCFRQPSFGIEGQKRARYCSEHKHPGMINVSSRRCRALGCLRHPNFGFQSDRRASYCCRHKAPDMVDIVSRRCKQPQCVRRPLYAMAGQRAVLCRIHKEPGMTDVVSRRCDYEKGCDRHPSFGWKQEGGKARRCGHHRLEGMESVKVKSRGQSQAASLVADDMT